MELDVFSIIPAVKDVQASKALYEKFGSKVFGGDAAYHRLIMKNGTHDPGILRSLAIAREAHARVYRAVLVEGIVRTCETVSVVD